MENIVRLSKATGEWDASYLGQDKCYHWIESGKTKDELILKLAKRIYKEIISN